MAHYASNLDSSPATAPALPPVTTASASQPHGSHLALPDLRSSSPLPTALGLAASHEVELASETQSVSSASGVTYTFPSAAANPFTPAVTSPPVSGDKDEDELSRPAWAEEGLGSNELSTLPTGGQKTGSPVAIKEERPDSPLPPGAAPPVAGTEPERSGTQ